MALLAAMTVDRRKAIEVEVMKSGEGKGVEVKAVGQSPEGRGIRGRKKRRGAENRGYVKGEGRRTGRADGTQRTLGSTPAVRASFNGGKENRRPVEEGVRDGSETTTMKAGEDEEEKEKRRRRTQRGSDDSKNTWRSPSAQLARRTRDLESTGLQVHRVWSKRHELSMVQPNALRRLSVAGPIDSRVGSAIDPPGAIARYTVQATAYLVRGHMWPV